MLINPILNDLLQQQDWFGLVVYILKSIGITRLLVMQGWLIAFGCISLILLLRYLWSQPWHKPGVPFMLGPVLIDLMPGPGKAIHLGIGGVTGLGKSSCILPLLDLDIGVLVIALDNTRPIATRIRELSDGIEWSNEADCQTAWYMLGGSADLVSEQLVAGWPQTQDSGHYRRIARMRMWDRLEQADLDGEVRSLPMLIEALSMNVHSEDPNVNRACRDWATKLKTMVRVLGPGHIGGPGDLDIVPAMRARKKVLFRLNNYLHPEDAPVLGGMLLVQARRAAQEAGVPFILVIEEAGALRRQKEHIEPLAQAARDRDVAMILISQNLAKLPDEVTNNLSGWVSFAQEDDNEVRFAAKRLRLESDVLLREKFKNGGERWAYVRAPGVRTTLVHITEFKPAPPPKPVKAVPFRRPIPAELSPLPALNHWQPYRPLALSSGTPMQEPVTVEVIDVEDVRRGQAPWWVGRDPDALRFWRQTYRTERPVPLWSPGRGTWWDERGDLEWHGPLSKPKIEKRLGRPRSNIGRASVTVYIETARMAGLVTEKTLDHCCANPICVDPTHLEECSSADNNSLRPVRDAELRAAWLDRDGEVPAWWQNRYYARVVQDCPCHAVASAKRT